MSEQHISPPLPPRNPARFRATVHGTVFAQRSHCLNRVTEGDELLLLPDPPTDDDPGVWVHLRAGDVVGHLPPEIGAWLGPWMLRGGRATARAVRVRGEDCPSWRRLVIEVNCGVTGDR